MDQFELRLSTLNVGDLIDGRYEVQGVLGSGGMGDVWLVQHRELAQRFALKTLKPQPQHSPERLQRFLREARAAAALQSRYIVRVVDGRSDYHHHGVLLPFIVMEYMKGASVEERITLHGPCSVAEASWLLGCLGHALRVAHNGGLVHRDVKPANLFIADGEEGEPTVKLGDFGVVKLMDEALLADSAMTASGTLLGTPMYMAPEQLRGKREIGPQADQWSFAMVAFYVLTGSSYFEEAETMADLIASALSARLVPPSQKSSRFPVALDPWFLRSCSQVPEERFRDIDDQVREFTRLLGEPKPEPIHPHGTSGGAQAASLRSRASASSWWGGIAAGVFAAGAVMAWAWVNQDRIESALFPGVPSRAVPSQRNRQISGGQPLVDTASTSLSRLGPAVLASESGTPANGSSSPRSSSSVGPEPAVRGAPAGRDTARPAPLMTAAGSPASQTRVASGRRSSRASSLASALVGTTPREPSRRPSGASCTRSAECESGLCVAEVCR